MDEVLHQDSLPYLANLPDNSFDHVITDPPYPNAGHLFTDRVVDGIAGLYLCAKKAKQSIVFFWSALTPPPPPAPGFFEVARCVWVKTDARSPHDYELIVVWSKDYRRKAHRTWIVPIADYRSIRHGPPAHPTQKPLRLMLRILEAYTAPGETILDPFAGSGTTGVAARMLKRHYTLVEHNADYVEYAKKRLTPPNTQPPTGEHQEELPTHNDPDDTHDPHPNNGATQ